MVRRTPKVSKRVREEPPEEPKGEKPVKFFGEEVEEKEYRPPEVMDELYDDLFETVGGGDDDDDDDDNNVIIRETEPESTWVSSSFEVVSAKPFKCQSVAWRIIITAQFSGVLYWRGYIIA